MGRSRIAAPSTASLTVRTCRAFSAPSTSPARTPPSENGSHDHAAAGVIPNESPFVVEQARALAAQPDVAGSAPANALIGCTESLRSACGSG